MQRYREIGLRIALGAPRASVYRLVLRDGLLPVATGAASGVALAFGSARLVSSLLVQVSPYDPSLAAGAELEIVTIGRRSPELWPERLKLLRCPVHYGAAAIRSPQTSAIAIKAHRRAQPTPNRQHTCNASERTHGGRIAAELRCKYLFVFWGKSLPFDRQLDLYGVRNGAQGSRHDQGVVSVKGSTAAVHSHD